MKGCRKINHTENYFRVITTNLEGPGCPKSLDFTGFRKKKTALIVMSGPICVGLDGTTVQAMFEQEY